MQYSKAALTLTLAALLVSAASCSRAPVVSQARICDQHRETPTRTDDCDYVQGYYYDPISQALLYRAVLGGSNTTIVRNNYILPSGSSYSPGQNVTLPNPIRSNASIKSSSQTATPTSPSNAPARTTAPTQATPSAPIRSNQNFAAPKAAPSKAGSPAPASRGTSFSSPGRSGG